LDRTTTGKDNNQDSDSDNDNYSELFAKQQGE